MSKLQTVEKIDNGIEELLITGMIVDDNFFYRFKSIALPEFFESVMCSIIAEWLLEYGKYNESTAPKEGIFELYKFNKEDFDEDEAKTVRIFLKRIIDQYKRRDFNIEYVAIRAVPYMEKQAYRYYLNRVGKLLDRDRIKEAVELFHNIPSKTAENVRNWVDFTDPSLVNMWWDVYKKSIMSFPHELSKYLPPIRPGKLYALLAPAKRGKSFWLLYWAYIAAIDGLNVIFISLEMETEEVHERLAKMVTGKEQSDKKTVKSLLPVFDCAYNQTGECQRKECTSKKTVVAQRNGKDLKMEPYEGNEKHKPCTKCRGTDRFEPSTWFVPFKQDSLTKSAVKKDLKKFRNHISGDRLKIISYPINTATPSDIEKDLNTLEKEHFHADVIVIDYAQIMKLDKNINDKRNQINNVYMECSRIAKTRGSAVVTGAQGTRGAARKNHLSVDDVAEDWGIIMIIDGIIAINEENYNKDAPHDQDRYWQRQRIETLALRYGKILAGRQCLVLNDFARAQINIDSVII